MIVNLIKNIVLVPGAFVDGFGWQRVYDPLKADGFTVRIVQNPTISLQGDVAATTQQVEALGGPAVFVGHSCDGAVVTEAGNHDQVEALVSTAAFVPDEGESVSTLSADRPSGVSVPPIFPSRDGPLFLPRDDFAVTFAADVPASVALFMADSQVPWEVDAAGRIVTDAAWCTKPSWYLVAPDDHMIPPLAQRMMSGRPAPGSQRFPAVMRSTCRSPRRWPHSSCRRRTPAILFRGGSPNAMPPLVRTTMPDGRCQTRFIDVEAIGE
jgi:hypothetical protein